MSVWGLVHILRDGSCELSNDATEQISYHIGYYLLWAYYGPDTVLNHFSPFSLFFKLIN